MDYRLEISPLPGSPDPRANSVRSRAAQFLELSLDAVRTRDVYTISADLKPEQITAIADEINNPVIQQYRLNQCDADCDWLIEVGFLPGVTDNVGRTSKAIIRDMVGRRLEGEEDVFSSVEYLIDADLAADQVRRIAVSLLANPLINSIRIHDREACRTGRIPANTPRFSATEEVEVKTFDLEVPDAELIRISEAGILALSLEEMKTIQAYFRQHGNDPDRQQQGLGPAPTDVELEALAQTWSEHCKHKIFDAVIDYVDDETATTETITSLYKSCIKKSTAEIARRVDWLLSVFKDNAGVIAFNDKVDLVYKVETHNSPSALDPYGGAMTGIVGVNRDPMGTGQGANMLANVWGYCLASPYTDPADVPEGLLHPRIIRDGVHDGVIEGGNQSGIPYVYGWEFFDERYLGKPLVFCGTVGTLPKTANGRKGYEKSIETGDLVVMAGGRIGKDGIHGATFSSEELHTDSPVQAVQIGDPITQKKLYDFTMEARDKGLYRFITDNGAGGLSSSVGEMASECGGVFLDVGKAPLKYAGLQPWEILLSEAQERMSYAVPTDKIEEFKALAERREVEVTVMGEFNDSGKIHVGYNGKTIAYLDIDFFHEGCPRMALKAHWVPPQHEEPEADLDDPAAAIKDLLGRLNLCSNESKARRYDHEVKGLNVVKPYVGVENDVQSDACVFMIEPLSREGVITTAAILPRYSDIDTYHMAASVIDLAVRRTIAVGGRLGHIAGLDNFCWPDPVESEKTPDGQYKLAQLVRANKALYDMTTAYNVPCISGKDSMKNDSTRGGRKISIPPTLLFSTIARMDDVSKAVTLDVKRVKDLVYVLGETAAELGGGEYYAMLGAIGNKVPTVNPKQALSLYDAVSRATAAEICHSIHTPAAGGLAVAFARKCLAGRLGMVVDLAEIPGADGLDLAALLFSESNSRFVVTVAVDRREEFETMMAGQPCACVGRTVRQNCLTLKRGDAVVAELAVDDMLQAFKSGLAYE